MKTFAADADTLTNLLIVNKRIQPPSSPSGLAGKAAPL